MDAHVPSIRRMEPAHTHAAPGSRETISPVYWLSRSNV